MPWPGLSNNVISMEIFANFCWLNWGAHLVLLLLFNLFFELQHTFLPQLSRSQNISSHLEALKAPSLNGFAFLEIIFALAWRHEYLQIRFCCRSISGRSNFSRFQFFRLSCLFCPPSPKCFFSLIQLNNTKFIFSVSLIWVNLRKRKPVELNQF